MATQIQLRNGTAAAWTAANPVMAVGEVGVETDTSKLKIGDGVTAWNTLAYATGGSGVTVQDEGVALATAGTTLNFVGAGVVATGIGAVKTVTIAGGSSTLAGASDYATATINTGNTPLANALAAKADALSAVILGVGPTAITRAAHLNRPVSSAQAGATSITFAATATSGALAGDGFECLNTGAGTMTASGAITAATGYKLTALTGEVFSAVYNAATDSFYSTTPSAASSFTGGTLTSALNEAPSVTIASAATVNIGAAAANTINVSGTTTITAFDTIASGAIRRIVFSGILTLTYNATSLILPGGVSITTAAGDAATFLSLGAGNWRCIGFERASGAALTGGSGVAYTKVLNQQFPGITCPVSQSLYCLAAIPLPILKAGTKVEIDLRFTNTGAGSKDFFVYLATTASTPGVTGVVGSALHTPSSASAYVRLNTGFQNMNSVSAQTGPADAAFGESGQFAIAARTTAINTGAVSYVNIYCNTTATDTVKLDSTLAVGIDATGL